MSRLLHTGQSRWELTSKNKQKQRAMACWQQGCTSKHRGLCCGNKKVGLTNTFFTNKLAKCNLETCPFVRKVPSSLFCKTYLSFLFVWAFFSVNHNMQLKNCQLPPLPAQRMVSVSPNANCHLPARLSFSQILVAVSCLTAARQQHTLSACLVLMVWCYQDQNNFYMNSILHNTIYVSFMDGSTAFAMALLLLPNWEVQTLSGTKPAVTTRS